MDIIFYKYIGYTNQLNKTLENGLTITGNFNINFDTRNTILRLQGYNTFDYNYCYIPNVNRYFFITNVDIRRNGIVFLTLHIDVIQTYKQELLNSKIRLESDNTNNTLTFKSDNIVNSDSNMILVTIGG